MPITYPLTWPTDPPPRRLVMAPQDLVAASESPFTFQQQRVRHQGQRWAFEAEMRLGTRKQHQVWRAFLNSLKGKFGSFLFGDVTDTAARGVGTGAPVVSGASQTGETLATTGWTINITGILLAGDRFQVASRLYEVMTDANSDGSGNATLDLWPRLRESPADTAALTLANPKGTFILAENVRRFEVQPPHVLDLVVRGVEEI